LQPLHKRYERRFNMIILTTVEFPPQNAKEIGKRFLESTSLPDYLTRIGPYVLPLRGEGFQSLTIYQVDRPTRIAEAIEFLSNDMAKYFDVPGFTHSVSICLDGEEALKTVGLG
jgi:hypothetical protein